MKQAMKLKTTHSLIEKLKTLHIYTSSHVSWLQTHRSTLFQNLKRLGIHANVKLIDVAQYIERLENFNYDMIVASFPQSPSPGLEQIDYWHSSSAHKKGSRN